MGTERCFHNKMNNLRRETLNLNYRLHFSRIHSVPTERKWQRIQMSTKYLSQDKKYSTKRNNKTKHQTSNLIITEMSVFTEAVRNVGKKICPELFKR